jgi:hypothetical protein
VNRKTRIADAVELEVGFAHIGQRASDSLSWRRIAAPEMGSAVLTKD